MRQFEKDHSLDKTRKEKKKKMPKMKKGVSRFHNVREQR